MEWTEEKIYKLYQKLEERARVQINACGWSRIETYLWDDEYGWPSSTRTIDGFKENLEAFGIQLICMSKSLFNQTKRCSWGWLEGDYVVIRSPLTTTCSTDSATIEHFNFILKVPKDIAERILILGM